MATFSSVGRSGLMLLCLADEPRLQPPPGYSPLDEVVYAIHKPRNVLSAVGKDNSVGRSGKTSGHRTLSDVMVDAGVEPLPGHCGRLDVETSGLMLVTSDSLLLRAVLNWPEVLEAYGGTPLTKRYSLLLAGRHEPLRDRVQHRVGRRLARLEPEHLRAREAFDDDLLDRHGALALGLRLVAKAGPAADIQTCQK